MSRVGRKPIQIPKGVEVKIADGTIEVKGPKGKMSTPIPQGISFKVNEGQLVAERTGDEYSALHGMARALAANAVRGVTEGFTRQLDVVGVGYKAELKGKSIIFSLGYSHPIEFPVPDDIQVKIDRLPKAIPQYQASITITGTDKQRLGQIAANMRSLRKPDAYKGKGVRYAEETLKLKPGKTGK